MLDNENWEPNGYGDSRSSNRKIIGAVIMVGIIIVIGVVVLKFSNPPVSHPVVRISSLEDGQVITEPIRFVSGHYQNIQNNKIWLMLMKDSLCFPMGGPAMTDTTGNWSHGPMIFYDTGQYELAPVLVNEEISIILKNAVGNRDGIRCPENDEGITYIAAISLEVPSQAIPTPTSTYTPSPTSTSTATSTPTSIPSPTSSTTPTPTNTPDPSVCVLTISGSPEEVILMTP